MENIINKISEIEATAAKIMENVSAQKKDMAAQMDSDSQTFNSDVDAKTAKQLEKIRQQLEVEKESQLTALRTKTESLVQNMETYYEKNHSQLALKVYNKLLRM